ncbi:MBOAT-domain-containing protein [Agrocybe pediades]|nr:MBOAT-domain-containing protein [Agrocybe pediades]
MSPDRSDKPRDVPAATGIAQLTVHIPSAFKENVGKGQDNDRTSKSRWRTPEFYFYYVIFILAVPVMAWIPISLSQASHPNYAYYSRRLSPGWLHGRMVDNSDAQYRSFRNNVPILCKAALGYLVIKYFTRRFRTIHANVVLSLIMVVALHGSSSVKILLIMAANYTIATKTAGSKLGPLLTWAFNGAVLFANEIYQGYSFGSILPILSFLDAYSGAYPAWHVMFNITMLRLISFNMDYHWSRHTTTNTDVDVLKMTDKERTSTPHNAADYSVLNYVAYVLYPPLYIAGPIMTFNDFMWQFKQPLLIETRFKIMYAIRLIFCFLTMEYILHYMYMVAIKDKKAWVGDSPAEVAMIGFWNLIIMWLKLLIPWRFFRLWALLDGVDPPENMVRCMANNYSTFGFWRSWHRSYNLWIIRYIYIPMGGAKNVFVNTVLVFSFVALWHDLTFRLLAWGWLVSLFVVPEIIASILLPPKKYSKYPWYRHVCAVGGVMNILMMMAANLVGFVVGTEGVAFFFSQLFGTMEGLRFMILCSFCLFVGVQLMFEYREEELRQGIVRRC